jgi:hypothetical protein
MKKQATHKTSVEKARRIEGVVTSVGGVLGPGTPALVVFLCPWRELDGPAQRRELRIEVPVRSKAAINKGMEKWDGKTVSLLCERVRKATGNFLEQNVARSPLREVTTAPALATEATELAKPQSVTSRLLGELHLNRHLGWYEGTRRRGGLEYSVHVDVEDPDNSKLVERTVQRACELVRGVEQMLPVIREGIATKLLGTYNDIWREDAPVLSAAAFKRRQVLHSIGVCKQRITVHFDCDGLFTDHGVEVRMSPRLRIQEVLIA